jgi:hypothetical protein
MRAPSSNFVIRGKGVVREHHVAGETVSSSSSHAVPQVPLARNDVASRVAGEGFQ